MSEWCVRLVQPLFTEGLSSLWVPSRSLGTLTATKGNKYVDSAMISIIFLIAMLLRT